MGRIVTNGLFSGSHDEGDESHELNLASRIASDPDEGTVEIAFESRGARQRNRVQNTFADRVFARKMAYIQREMLAAQKGEAYRNRPVTPLFKSEKRTAEKRKVCVECGGVGRSGGWTCDDCRGNGWVPAR